MEKRKLISQILAFLVTAVMAFSPLSVDSVIGLFLGCFCGGCCLACPGNCNVIGMPFAWYYWGWNSFRGPVGEISWVGLVIDIVVWFVVMLLIHKYVYKKGSKKEKRK
ncbi:hypothetical protein H0N99_03450 [Candidatus Micrarchaeota archaeon]|nr:hypothetical protein [Candidatus Micrarchaeota archaeon]